MMQHCRYNWFVKTDRKKLIPAWSQTLLLLNLAAGEARLETVKIYLKVAKQRNS